MARRVVRSAINAALDNLNQGTKIAKEVVESTGKSASRATMIKNTVNQIQSNMGGTTTKVLNEAGEAAVNSARREGINAALNQVNARPVSQVLENSSRQGQSAAQKAYEAVNNKKVSQVIDGHNAQARQTAMDTIVNNVKDGNINRNPQNSRQTRNIVNQSVENVRNNRTANTIDMSQPQNQMPINNFNTNTNRMNTMDTGPQASPFIHNGPDRPRPTGFKESETQPQRPLPEAKPSPFENQNQSQSAPNSSTDNKTKANNKGYADQAKGFAKEMFGGVTDTYKGFQNGQDIVDSFVNAHKNADGSVNMLRAAGTFMTASAAGRIASGGGIYKDRYGNPNLIGLPFI